MQRLIPGALVLAALWSGAAEAETPTATCLSVIPSTGATGNFGAFFPLISANGRFVAFTSASVGFVPGDTNGRNDVFVRDLDSGVITRVSLAGAGTQANHNSSALDISPDGRFVVFRSVASNLATPPSVYSQVYLRDRLNSVTELISVSWTGAATNELSLDAAVSEHGERVAFSSFASNILPGDTNAVSDIFLRDRADGSTTLLTIGSAGEPANGGSRNPVISLDGRYVVFESSATNLTPEALSESGHIFMHDTQSGTTTRLTAPGRGGSSPRISGDARFVVFVSPVLGYAPGNSQGWDNVILHDRSTGEFRVLSALAGGGQPLNDALRPDISKDGRFVVFHSRAGGMVPGDGDDWSDVFLYDRVHDRLVVASRTSAGFQPNGPSDSATVADGGARVAFQSDSETMHMPDLNDEVDVYLREHDVSLFCAGDVNGDYRVDMTDLAHMLDAFNTLRGQPGYLRNADFDADDDVDFADLNVVLWAYNKGC